MPDHHLEQIRPLEVESAARVADVGHQVLLKGGVPFEQSLFPRSETLDIRDWRLIPGSEKRVKKWLFQRGPAFKTPVYLSWDESVAVLVSWKIFIRYWSHFYYSTSDDLLIFDDSMSWAFYFSAREEIFFGSSR